MKKKKSLLGLLLLICFAAGFIQISVYAANRNTAAVWLNNTWHNRNGITAEFEQGSGSYEISSSLGTKLGLNGDGGNLGFLINSDISFPESSAWKFKNAKKWSTFCVDICYWDEGMGGFYFQYDSHNGIKNIFVQCENTKTWKYARIKLYDARFNGNANGYDCRIVTHDKSLFPYAENNASPETVYIYWLKIHSDDCYSSFDIKSETGKPGNVFYEGDDIKFDFTFTNTDSTKYENMRVTYSVYKPEAKDEYLQWEETSDTANKGKESVAYSTQTPISQKIQTAEFSLRNASDTVSFDNLPFGTYVLKVDIAADYLTYAEKMKMSCLVDFSYSKKARPNAHFGTNAHYDDYYYDENRKMNYLYDEHDIDNQIALARDAGFGKVRSTIRWVDVQKSAKGEYNMPDILVYPYKALSENGMSGLCNLMAQNNNGYGANWDGENILGDTEEELTEFAKYARFVASYLKPYTRYYALLNEFDLRGAANVTGLSGDNYDMPSENAYAAIVTAGSDAIKAQQSDAWIDVGQIAEDPAWQFTRWYGKYTWDTRFFKIVDNTKFDSVSYHRYDSYMDKGPEGKDLIGFTAYGKLQTQKYAPDAKLWVTEVGWPSRNRIINYSGTTAFRNTNYEKQAAYISRLLAMYASDDIVDMLMFYEFQDDREDPFSFEENFGIIHSKFFRTSWAAKPAYIAAAAFNSLTGKTVKSESLAAKPEYGESYTSFSPVVYKLTNNGGRETYCVWSTGVSKKYTVNTGKDYAVVYDIYGNETDSVAGGTVTVTADENMKYVIGYDYPKTEIAARLDGNVIIDLKSVKDGDVLKFIYTQAVAELPESTVVCAAYKGGRLVEIMDYNNDEYTGEKILTAQIGDIDKIDTIKVFALDNNLRAKIKALELEK